jgi:PAS domain S-box-containing protein
MRHLDGSGKRAAMDDTTVSAQALRESEELHRITLSNIPDAVFITNDDGAFTYICPNVDVTFGYGPDEVRAMGRISALLGTELADRTSLTAQGELRNIEHDIVTRSGARRVVLVHIKRVAISRRTILYVCRDITERKESEEALRQNEERLTLALDAADMSAWDWDLTSGEALHPLHGAGSRPTSRLPA